MGLWDLWSLLIRFISISIVLTVLLPAICCACLYLFCMACGEVFDEGPIFRDAFGNVFLILAIAGAVLLTLFAFGVWFFLYRSKKQVEICRSNDLLNTLMSRFELIKGAYLAFWQKNGRAPGPRDAFELPNLPKPAKYSETPLVLLYPGETAKDGARPEIEGLRVVVAPLKPWASPHGLNSIVLLENGETRTILLDAEAQRIHRIIDDVVEQRGWLP